MTDLTGSGQPIPLGSNFRIRAPGVRGQANLVLRRSTSGVTRSTTAALERTALDRALSAQEMEDIATVDVTITQQIASPAGSALRSPSGDEALELEVPAPPEGHDAVLISVDESGAITWNYPLADDNTIAPPVTRGAGDVVRFRVPRTPAVAPRDGTGINRSIFGSIGKKILKVLVYPITDRLVGPLVDRFAGNWEAKNRPYRLRTVTPDNYAVADAASLTTGDPEWERLTAGRALLFVHGTFSSTHSGFAGLSKADVEGLSAAYQHRLFGFDHFTLSHSPDRNARELASLLPTGRTFDVDIVCHSRGGLVTREIVERNVANGLAGRVSVRNVVFVGVPNSGTLLSHPDHMTHMIDRMTTAIDALPDGPVAYILEGIITAVKVIGHGGLTSLDGLAAMNPQGAYLRSLGAGSVGRATYHGVAADFEPAGTAFGRLTLKDALMDRIFEDAMNDLVVPTEGVATAAGPCFPIDATNMLMLASDAGVTHTTYFGNQDVRDRLKTWLKG